MTDLEMAIEAARLTRVLSTFMADRPRAIRGTVIMMMAANWIDEFDDRGETLDLFVRSVESVLGERDEP